MYSTAVLSGVGAFAAVVTLFLIATTAYMGIRVYKMKKYYFKEDHQGKERLDVSDRE